MIFRRWIFVGLVLLIASAAAVAQPADSLPGKPHVCWTFAPSRHAVDPPYSGKYEARIGGSRESANSKLRLDIGASVDIVSLERLTAPNPSTGYTGGPTILALGADFFTWTRLRANDNFKFPVEAVDYYFGIHSSWFSPTPWFGNYGPEIRLRIAHISAHLVDGDPSFTNPQQQYMTYSREFADVMLGFKGTDEMTELRPYIGTLWLFHTIPDTLGVVTPYAGFDFNWQPDRELPLTIKAGYEARLNTELAPIGEHQVRVGLKLGNVYSRGIVIEVGYYSGRSHYGQHFSQRERYFSLGFAVDY